MTDQKQVILLALMLSVASAQYYNYPIQLGGPFGGFVEPHDTINQNHAALFWANTRYLPKDAPVPFHHHGWHDVYSHDHHHHGHGCGCGSCHNHYKPNTSYLDGCLKLCPKTGTTICGSDGKTYTNLCIAACHGASCNGTGPCVINSCDCSKCDRSNFQPVCASDGNSYFNNCWATCAHLTVTSQNCCDGTTTSCYGDALNRINRLH